ncbi:G protein gamma subunit, putative [Candida dubliniensis CD36]|uniref:Guanine nucleotide-binding protein subunit gamma n=1 Tax=Candida dubliniensis (strain CD36 / ATCC MYA-646 / CBS 7987 / NCPF 3949 / NRRL Y-17841) TaxID=573826 RepID=B9WK58_CANDC|nr:G protein gamma subunit, putative [Candida dubliniensis CD36]CAX40709.1 G protein gamma subunit, putative [Candida dubliniensis CD36]
MNEQIEYQIQVIRLKRIQELTNRLKLALQRERIPASTASGLIINYVEETPDYLIPYNWSLPPDQNRFAKYKQLRNARNSTQATVGCCTIV